MGHLNGMNGGINLIKGLISSVMKTLQILMMSLTFLTAKRDQQKKNLKALKQPLPRKRKKPLHLKKFLICLKTL
ncbi:putative alternative large T antigen [Rhinolophus hildebrandtii polyomavirus 1]|uniref:putative alternative large T antigen n=1 Tax=Rhinolophus hildebrandtii polyomavirus 1 TaxID=1904410 RepID=UPI0009A4CC64|nr:putative alternative large T antigen [Rhinolophus hildebrandtii polyomavirus 1]BAX01888.1 putative alternative large T antigen [Rhinolophus hildebrandtii polyomavirus 1]